MIVYNVIEPTEDFNFYVRYWETKEIDEAWQVPICKFEIFSTGSRSGSTWYYTNKDGTDCTATVDDAAVTMTASFPIGLNHLNLNGNFFLGFKDNKKYLRLFERLMEVVWEYCPKQACFNCHALYYEMSQHGDAPTGQADDCATFYSEKYKNFIGSYGSSQFDLDVLEPTSSYAWALLLNGRTPGPNDSICDNCIRRWVDAGHLKAYHHNEWTVDDNWQRYENIRQ